MPSDESIYWRVFLSTCCRDSLYETSHTRDGRVPAWPNETSGFLQILLLYLMSAVPNSLIDLSKSRIRCGLSGWIAASNHLYPFAESWR